MPNRGARLATLLVLLLTLLATASAHAAARTADPNTTHVGAAAATGADARVMESSADARFLDQIAFHLVAEADRPIERVQLFWHAADEPVLSAEFPAVTPGTRVVVDDTVDMAVNYLPPGVDIAWFWRLTDDGGHVTDSPANSLLYMDDAHDWRTKTDGLTTLYWYRGDDAFAQDVVDTANRTIATLRDRFHVNAEQPIRLVIYGSEDDFSASLPPNSAEWIGGQAHPQLRLIVAGVDPTDGAAAEIRRMVPHEVSHLIVQQATENPYNSPPNWLDEGLAVYDQETPDSRFPGILKRATERGQLIPVRALNSSFPLDADQALLSYAESESVVGFIIARYGDDQLGALLNSFKREMTYDEAVQSALGISLDELDAQWKASLGYGGDRPAADTVSPGRGGGDQPLLLTIGVLLGMASCAALFVLAVVALVVWTRQRRHVAAHGPSEP